MSLDTSEKRLDRVSTSSSSRSSSLERGSYHDSDSIESPRFDSDKSFYEPSRQQLRRKRFTTIICMLVFMSVVLLTTSGLPRAGRSLTTEALKAKRKTLVMATRNKTKIEWLERVPKDWEQVRYVSDDPNAEYTVPLAQGNEAISYITYVVDHYENLPDYMIFTHGHNVSWHQPEPMEYIIQALNLPLLDELGLVSLRCALQNTCEGPKHYVYPIKSIKWDLSAILVRMHEFVFRPEDEWYEPLPEAFAFPCCGQFAVTRQQVLKKPFRYWERIQFILTRNITTDFPDWETGKGGPSISWKLGGVFEFTWHWWFSMPSVVCLDTDYCRKTVFQDKIHCSNKTWDWVTAQPKWRNITCTLDD